MKRFSSIILGLLFGVLLFNSCVNEDEIDRGGEGKKTSVNFSFVTPQAEQITTKSLSDYNLVEDLYVFIFKTDGSLEYSEYFEGNQLSNGTIDGSIETTTGDHYIYAVANIKDESNSYATIDDLSSITTRGEFLKKKAHMKGNKLSVTGNIIPMVGIVGTDDGLINIKENDALTIKLKRIVSSIKFDVSCNPGQGKQATFELKSYEVINIPSTSTLIGDNELNGSGLDPWKEGTISKTGTSQIFDFYMFENIKATKGLSTYDARETKKDPAQTENIAFKNAPSNSTYVILRGKYTGDANTTVVGGQANEKVNADVSYYIHLGNIGENAPHDYNNFENRRNVEYTYKITITGVDKLIAEVVSKDPYDRGDGVISLVTNTYNLDSHYETFNIELNPQLTYQLSEGESLDWLSFRLMDKKNQNYLTKALLPGSEDGEWVDVMKYKYSKDNSYSKALVVGRDKGIDGLNGLLAAYKATNPNATSVTITCYADENVGWTATPRSVSILTADLVKNGSKLIQEGIILKQDGIRTFFNNQGNGYGVESLNESGRLSDYGTTNTTQDMANGLSTMKKEVGTSWPSVENMKKIYAACMSRNRDENGNDEIDNDEMKWYLPAINQYIGMWSGADALGDARLYKLTTRTNEFRYISNTYKNGEKQVLWADQGSSTGRKSQAQVGSFQLRCIRNLGNGAATYTYSDRKFTLYLNQEALRAKQEKGELGKHTHADADNKLYKSFKIAADYINDKKNWINHNDLANNNKSVCSNYHEGKIKDGYKYAKIYAGNYYYFKYVGAGKGKYDYEDKFVGPRMVENKKGAYIIVDEVDAYEDGRTWRLPNQRELSLMYSEGQLNTNNVSHVVSRTWDAFGGGGAGFGYDGNLRLYDKDEHSGSLYSNFKVRCVRDVD